MLRSQEVHGLRFAKSLHHLRSYHLAKGRLSTFVPFGSCCSALTLRHQLVHICAAFIVLRNPDAKDPKTTACPRLSHFDHAALP